MQRDDKATWGVRAFILISMFPIRFQEIKQDLIGSSFLNKQETGSS